VSGLTSTRLMLLVMAALAVQDFSQPAAAQAQLEPSEEVPDWTNLANQTAGATIAQVPVAIAKPTFLLERPPTEQPESRIAATPPQTEEIEPQPVEVDGAEPALEPVASVGNGNVPDPRRLSLTIAQTNLGAIAGPRAIAESDPQSWQVATLAPGETINFDNLPGSILRNNVLASASTAAPSALVPSNREVAVANPSPSRQVTSTPDSTLLAQRPIGIAAQPSGNYTRRISQPQRLTAIRVTNRTGRTILIELVGRTGPLILRPGQTRQLRVNPRDLSLMYWVPRNTVELTAQVSRPQANLLVVGVRESRFPRGNRALYLPDPGGTTVLRVF